MENKLRIDWCSHAAAKFAVMNWHYSKRMPTFKHINLGVWEDEVFRGVVIFGNGASPFWARRYGVEPLDSCELLRIALRDHVVPVSKVISISLKILKVHSPGIRLVVSFADPNQGHHGGVYQAAGWVYTGVMKFATTEYMINGKSIHNREFNQMCVEQKISRKELERHPSVTVISGLPKHRYLKALCSNLRGEIELLRQPYPKRVGSIENDAPAHQQEEGGEIPTPALQKQKRERKVFGRV